MTFLEAIFKHMGYVRAQSKPNDFPENYPSTDKTEDMERQKLQDSKQSDGDITAPPLSTHPEQLTGEPNHALPKVDLSHSQDEILKVQDVGTPFEEQMNIGNPQEEPRGDITEHQLKDPRSMNIEEVSEQNHAIAMKMKAKGILAIDREIFMNKYKELQRKAALARKPLSEYLDEIL